MKKPKTNGEEQNTAGKNADNLSGNEVNDGAIDEKSAVQNHDSDSNEKTDNNAEAGAIGEQIQQEEDLQKIKQDLEIQVLELKDKYIRLSAEFDNYRKRTLKEKIDLSRYAGEELLKSLLPVVDDFERGIKNLEQASDMEAVKEGIFLIYNKFKDFMQQKGLKEIEALNIDFNTDFHEAITKIPVEDKSMSGKIVDVVQKGYVLDEKVIRFAKVVIGE
jgi:molecular chaperone GrpE